MFVPSVVIVSVPPVVSMMSGTPGLYVTKIPGAGGPRGLPGVDDAPVEAVFVLVSVVAPSLGGGVIESEVVAGAGPLPDCEVPVEPLVRVPAARSFDGPEPDTRVEPVLVVAGATVVVVTVGEAG